MIQDQSEMIANPEICMTAYWLYYGVDETCNCLTCMDEVVA